MRFITPIPNPATQYTHLRAVARRANVFGVALLFAAVGTVCWALVWSVLAENSQRSRMRIHAAATIVAWNQGQLEDLADKERIAREHDSDVSTALICWLLAIPLSVGGTVIVLLAAMPEPLIDLCSRGEK